MRLTAYKLTTGSIMQSGEIVIRVFKQKYYRNPKISVVLKNPTTGKTRDATWNYYGDLYVKFHNTLDNPS